ncbi:heme exporter protein CcmB [Alphaproteobacteria bacterium HT1-32]|nr:heme exporter protein CcmB [Alphaproteobacteria bacterium HT1-32]
MIHLIALIRRDLALAFRERSDSLLVIAFFVIAALLFPFGVGSEPNLLARIGPGVILAVALLAALLSLDRLFQTDYEDGSLELLATGPVPLGLVVTAKIIAHWLTTGLPLMLAAPLLSLFFNLPPDLLPALLLTMLLATPLLSLIGAIGAALTLGARRGGVLLSLLILPLYIPTLIFAAGALDAARLGLDIYPHLAILGAMLLTALPLCPLAATAGVRQALA